MFDQLRHWLLKRRSPHPATFPTQSQDLREIFSSIYHSNYWGNADSRSGGGSDLPQTAVIRERLPELLRAWNIRSLLDVPCGDFHWLAHVELDADYLGADIVPELIERNLQTYGGPRRTFRVLDITTDTVPAADLILARDLLVHFSFRDVARALGQMQRSGATYLLTTTFTGRDQNIDIATGQWRPLNLVKPPFEFPAPLELINENCTEGDGSWGDKSLGLWRLAELPTARLSALATPSAS